jgi:hypothetical protein
MIPNYPLGLPGGKRSERPQFGDGGFGRANGAVPYHTRRFSHGEMIEMIFAHIEREPLLARSLDHQDRLTRANVLANLCGDDADHAVGRSTRRSRETSRRLGAISTASPVWESCSNQDIPICDRDQPDLKFGAQVRKKYRKLRVRCSSLTDKQITQSLSVDGYVITSISESSASQSTPPCGERSEPTVTKSPRKLAELNSDCSIFAFWAPIPPWALA